MLDLVRNLHFLNPASTIVVYNGGTTQGLLAEHTRFERYGAVVHPNPQPLSWGRLHPFALDCMRFALENFEFDTLTIVDSDQLGTRRGYAQYIGAQLAGLDGFGMFGITPQPQTPDTEKHAPRSAFNELELWRPFLRRFPAGEDKFPYWTYWPSTVFSADACRDLTRLFDRDQQLQHIMRDTKILVTEEVILPTLVALLGYAIHANPCSYDFVKFRARFTLADLDCALDRPDVFWVHPIKRVYDDPLRAHIRRRLSGYQRSRGSQLIDFVTKVGQQIARDRFKVRPI